MIYMRNITIATAKSATYLENVGLLVYANAADRSELEVLKAKLKRRTPVNRFIEYIGGWIVIGILLLVASAIFGG